MKVKKVMIWKGSRIDPRTGEVIILAHLPGIGEVGFSTGEYTT